MADKNYNIVINAKDDSFVKSLKDMQTLSRFRIDQWIDHAVNEDRGYIEEHKHKAADGDAWWIVPPLLRGLCSW